MKRGNLRRGNRPILDEKGYVFSVEKKARIKLWGIPSSKILRNFSRGLLTLILEKKNWI